MAFDDLMMEIYRRVNDYRRTRRADLILSDEAASAAIQLWEVAQAADPLNPTPDETAREATARHLLGWFHFLRFEFTPPPSWDISEHALSLWFLVPLVQMPIDRVADLIPEPLRPIVPGPWADPEVQASTAGALLQHNQTRGDKLAVDVAIHLLTESARKTPRDHPELPTRLTNLAFAHRERFQPSGSTFDLDAAIEIAEHALAVTPPDHPERWRILANLAAACGVRSRHGGTMVDVQKAIGYGKQALSAGPPRYRHHLSILADVGAAYLLRFDRNEAVEDLRHGIQLLEQAVDSASDDPDLPSWLSILSGAYFSRFMFRGSATDVHRTIETGERALAILPLGHPARDYVLPLMKVAYFARLTPGDTMADPQRAIELGQQALAAVPADHAGRAGILNLLCMVHRARFAKSRAAADLDSFIEISERALSTTQSTTTRLVIHLGDAYRDRYDRAGHPPDLERAIELGERVLGAPDDDPPPWDKLAFLGQAYGQQYDRTGSIADLNRAIAVNERVLAARQPESAKPTSLLTELAGRYRSRFNDTGARPDLDRAIELNEQALGATAVNDPEHAVVLANLGAAYGVWFEHTPTEPELRARVLRRAIEVTERALDAMPLDNPLRAAVLSNLADIHRMRFQVSDDIDDLRRAIELGGQAVLTIPRDHPARASMLCNLGIAYHNQFDATGVVDSLRRAVETNEELLASTSVDVPEWPKYLSNLGHAYRDLFDASPQDVTVATLHALVDHCAAATIGSQAERAYARHAIGSLALAMDEPRIAVQLLDAAVKLLPSVAFREIDWADQHAKLGSYLGLVGEAIAAHLTVGDTAGALTVAESGRGVLLGTELDLRADLGDLEQARPDLAAQLRQAHNLIKPEDSAGRIDQRREAWKQYDDVLERIRRVPGFHYFPATSSPDRPLRIPENGAAVLVNVGRRRGDAIILTGDADPVSVDLPELRWSTVRSWAMDLLANTYGPGSVTELLRRRGLLTEILGWLWDTIVAPVIDTLAPAPPAKPRVWWLPTGLLGVFPLHAAGHLGQPGALDLVVSSYIPTLRALTHATERPRTAHRRQLTVALQHTPGLANLPGTTAEAVELHSAHPEQPLLSGPHATVKRVLTALMDSTWVHFACHARADLSAPSASGLVLHDGLLAVTQIGRLTLEQAELAYLSACSTASRGLWADEPLTLATAFQLAGFRHVIASMWPLEDDVAAATSRSFYRELPADPSADRAATALHTVTNHLRAQQPDRPDLWAALIHSGP